MVQHREPASRTVRRPLGSARGAASREVFDFSAIVHSHSDRLMRTERKRFFACLFDVAADDLCLMLVRAT
jgi:hypothetical protein